MGRRIGVKESRLGVQNGSANGRLERCGGQQPFPTSRPRTLYPESGDRSQRRGIEESENRIQDSGYGLRGKGAVVVVLRRRCFFSELRVITLKTKKYSILKTTTTTDYLHQSLQPQQAEAAVDPQRPQSPRRDHDQFFSQTHIYILHTHAKKPHPTGGVFPFTADSRTVIPLSHSLVDVPLPAPQRQGFSDKGCGNRGSLKLCSH